MKKVLIITYYWPPSGGSGVQRWLKFVKYLPQNGWKPIVIVPENAEYPVFDATLEKEIPPEAEIIKIPIWEPYSLFKKITRRKKDEKVNNGLFFDEKKQSLSTKFSLWIRGNLFIPDPRLFWVKPVTKKLIKLIPEINPDFIITTGTPHSIHLIARKIKAKFPKLPWLADLRDPWSDLDMLDSFHASAYAKKRHKKLEYQTLSAADVVTTVSPTWTKELQSSIPTPVVCITNGFDKNDFSNYKFTTLDDFVISHIGIINSYRNPDPLWKALEELCNERNDFREKLKLRIIGITDDGLRNNINKYPILRQKIFITGYIPHDEVIHEYQKASCLLLLLNNSKNSLGHIPGKFFEYLATGKPILAIAPPESDVAKIISENKIGFASAFDDKEAIKKSILSVFDNTPKVFSDEKINQFSRDYLTQKLTDLLEETIATYKK
ncbi:MAG: glycosyltransferase [Prolixibacteraceae bacterium]|nr:glycosyltransferase [Prolixibacteraceae bacterium]